VSDAEIIAKEQVETCIKLETSFINMNHPDFRERVRRGADSGSSKPELLRKGMVIIVEGAKGGLFRDAKKLFAKDYWVVVTTNMIVIFKDKTEEKQINRFRTQGLKIELVDSNTFTIYDPEGDKKPTRGPSPRESPSNMLVLTRIVVGSQAIPFWGWPCVHPTIEGAVLATFLIATYLSWWYSGP
jgi:hypothetical protein